jgi:uncharacterized protein YbjQ (UPF0145 family)
VIVSGMSGNELFCLHEKGFVPNELVVGNSVCSIGVVGGIGAWGTGITGGEITAVTNMISEGRHAAIERMRKEAEKHGAVGVTAVTSELTTLSGYMEFLAQGTAITGPRAAEGVFTTAASGMTLYCHLDAGYRPVKFAMGNVAYALGLGQGLMGSMRTMGRGEVKEFSKMYNHIRHLALNRLRAEALAAGANAVVDVTVKMLPFGPTATELLMTGTASHHEGLGTPKTADDVVTSELTGEELWNLARIGYVPVQLVMATSVYSLGVVGGIGAMFKGMTKGEIPELTKIVYEARENCVNLLKEEATKCGAERVVGNRLIIRELSPGLLEIVSIGTAVKRAEMPPASAVLIPQAIIVDRDEMEVNPLSREGNVPGAAVARSERGAQTAGQQAIGCIVGLISLGFMALVFGIAILSAIFGS